MSNVRKSLFWSFSERYLGLLIYLVTTMVLARILTPHEIGMYSLCVAFSGIASVLRDFGVSEYVIQEKNLDEEKLRSAHAVAFITAWSIGIVLFLLRDVIADYYKEPALVPVLSVACLNFFILPFASPSYALLHREMAFRQLFYIQTTTNLSYAAVGISLAWLDFGPIALAWASCLSILVQSLYVAAIKPRETFMLPRFRAVKGVLSYGTMFSSSRIIEAVGGNSQDLVIGRQFGFESLGLFSRAFSLIEMFTTYFSNTVSRVATPAFANSHREGECLATSYAHAVSIVSVIAIPFYLFMSLMAPDIIMVLFGPQWEQAAPIARALAAFGAITGLSNLALNVLTAAGQVKRRLQITMIVTPIHIMNIIIASMFSLQAITYAWLCTWVLTLFIYEYHLRQALSFGFIDLWKACRKSLLVAFTGLAIQVSLFLLINEFDAHSLVRLIIIGPLAVGTWVFLLKAFNHPLFAELLALYRSATQRLKTKQ